MKRKLLVSVSLGVLIAGMGFMQNALPLPCAEIFLSGTEALTAGESDDELDIVCLSDENSTCVYGNTVVLKAYYSAH